MSVEEGTITLGHGMQEKTMKGDDAMNDIVTGAVKLGNKSQQQRCSEMASETIKERR